MKQKTERDQVRTRIAPSPTGYPHIGTIYQALFNYAFAHKHDGSFIVRIEDTDRKRFVEGSEAVVFSALDWFGLTENESPRKDGSVGPYRQSERLSTYHTYAQELLDLGFAYFAYYPKEDAGKKKDYTPLRQGSAGQAPKSAGQAPHQQSYAKEVTENPPNSVKEMLKRGDWILRMKVPREEKITVKDEIRGEIVFETNQVTEQVLIKSDGYPTYHLAVVVDDHLMKISHIVRAEEWLSSLPKHVLLYRYFDWPMPPIYHTVTLRNPDKSKLSKRHGHTDVRWFKQEGYLPEAILNFLALLGWTHPEEKEIFSLSEFITLFDLKDIRSVAPIFDLTKLTWMNQQYIQMKSDKELQKLITAYYPQAKKLPEKTLKELMPLVKTRMSTLKEFEELTSIFFEIPVEEKVSQKEHEIVKELRSEIEKMSDWSHETIFQIMKQMMSKHGLKMPFFYKIFTGRERGLPLPQILEILGKERSIALLDHTIT